MDGRIENFDVVAVQAASVPGVFSVTPQVEGQAMLTANGVASGAVVRGMRPSDLKAKSLIADGIAAGSLDAFSGRNSIVLGTRLARRLGVQVGDQVTLISPTTAVTVVGSLPRMKAYDVVALFEVGMFEYDASFVYMPLDAAQVFFQTGSAVNALEIFTTDPDSLRSIRLAMLEQLPPELRFRDWQQQNSSFFIFIEVSSPLFYHKKQTILRTHTLTK